MIMKGYAKVDISKEVIDKLKAIIDESDEFYCHAYSAMYKKKVIKRSWLFFEKEVYIPDISKAKKDAAKYNCGAYLSCSGRYIHITQGKCVDQYRKIINLSRADDYYLDDELFAVLNKFNQHR